MIDGNLENLIKLYKEQKITQYVLEKELTQAVQKNVRCSVKIEDDIKKNTNTTFGITTLPELKNKNLYATYLIDKNLIQNFLTEEEILLFLFNETRNTQNILSALTRFCNEKKDMEMTVRDVLQLFLRIYSISLNNIPLILKEKFSQLNVLSTFEDVRQIIIDLENDDIDLEEIIEKIKTKDIIPHLFIEKAKELSRKSLKGDEDSISVDLTFDKSMPIYNAQADRIKEITSNSYDNLKSEISYDYYPSTNQ